RRAAATAPSARPSGARPPPRPRWRRRRHQRARPRPRARDRADPRARRPAGKAALIDWPDRICRGFPSAAHANIRSYRDGSEGEREMDRGSLALLLAQGVSVEEIGRRFNRHPSTIAYWMAKFGLEAPNRDKHAAKGGIERERLEELVAAGM